MRTKFKLISGMGSVAYDSVTKEYVVRTYAWEGLNMVVAGRCFETDIDAAIGTLFAMDDERKANARENGR